jgi:hypothetical protein
MKIVTAAELDGYVNKNIKDICPCGFWNDKESHCAHFVSHVMGYQFGYTCSQISGKGPKDKSVCVRVTEVFQHTRRFGKWADRPADLKSGLIFITKGSVVDVKTRKYGSIAQNHIGIFIGNDIWQYKNRVHHVVKQDPEEFSHHYDYKSKTGFEMFYGDFPL